MLDVVYDTTSVDTERSVGSLRFASAFRQEKLLGNLSVRSLQFDETQ